MNRTAIIRALNGWPTNDRVAPVAPPTPADFAMVAATIRTSGIRIDAAAAPSPMAGAVVSPS